MPVTKFCEQKRMVNSKAQAALWTVKGRGDGKPHPGGCAGGPSSAGNQVIILAALIDTFHALCAALKP